jgi:YesN/AraC family two-component response regulator
MRQKVVEITKYDGYLSKPIDVDQLLELMGQALGLEWLYEAEREVEATSQITTILPQADLVELYQYAAKEGNMRKVRQKGEALLTELGAEYHPFIQQVLELARGYEEKQLRLLLEQYLV